MTPYHETEAGVAYQGDCLDLMAGIPDKSVDMILCDLPYGTTACKWDTCIPFEPLWAHYKRIIKDRGAIVLTASQPFTSALVMSNPGMFKYEWIWDKVSKTDIMNANNKPLKQHENICIFSKGTTANKSNKRMYYFPLGVKPGTRPAQKNTTGEGRAFNPKRPSHKKWYKNKKTGYPSTIITFSNANRNNALHPTQKPVALFEYLIKTYTNEGDTVLDNCAGSGTTAIACIKTGRKYILMEKEPEYCETIARRIDQETQQLRLFA